MLQHPLRAKFEEAVAILASGIKEAQIIKWYGPTADYALLTEELCAPMLEALSKEIATKGESLSEQLREHSMTRVYTALAENNFKEDEGTVDVPIGRDPRDRLRRAPFGSGARNAVTHYKVLKRYGFVTFVECRLETGRTHQIRVHMSHIGHPLFNDQRYGGSEIRKGTVYAKYKQFIANCFEMCPRQALHARTLGFEHPSTGKWMQFSSELPADMTGLLERWDRFTNNNRTYEE